MSEFFSLLKDKTLFGNTLLDYLLTLAYILIGLIFVWVIKRSVLSRLKKWAQKTENKLDDVLVALAQKFIIPILNLGVFYAAISTLNLSAPAKKIIDIFGAILLTLYGIRFLLQTTKFFIFDYWILKNTERQRLEVQFRSMMPLISTLVWGVGLVFLFDNLGFDITAIITGLGIGGVAVALAASAILGDVFAYISIMFDRPFAVGDFLIVDDFLGTVEHVGIKTTRLKSLGGEQLVFSNKDLTDSRIKNYKRMQQRRVLFKLGVTYSTSLERMKEIPGVIKSVIENIPDTKFDRAHFSSFGDFNLEIEVVYYVKSGDYNKYMDLQQQINFGIKQEFEKRKIEFAFPTQTLHLVKQP